MSDKKDKSGIPVLQGEFYCPLGSHIMWWHGLQYSECPVNPSYRDMPECKNCKLRIDKKWHEHKETWKEEPVKNKKRKRRGKHQGGKK